MPNRVIREGFLDSEKIDALSAEAERLYHRLLLVCDDAGRFDNRPAMIAARCFPLKRDVRASDVARITAELARSGLLVFYEYQGKPYLQVTKWGKCHKAKFSKFPWSDGNHEIEYRDIQTRDGDKSFVASSLVVSDTNGMNTDPIRINPDPIDINPDPVTKKSNTETETETETKGPPANGGVLEWRSSKGVDIPDKLHHPEFIAEWRVWESHLRKKRVRTTDDADREQLEKCRGWGVVRSIAAIRHSIAGSYQGLFEPPGRRSAASAPPPIPAAAAPGREDN